MFISGFVIRNNLTKEESFKNKDNGSHNKLILTVKVIILN